MSRTQIREGSSANVTSGSRRAISERRNEISGVQPVIREVGSTLRECPTAISGVRAREFRSATT
jgi:hypothetical protein